MKDSLGDRMKRYESVPQIQLINRMPVIIRIDGQAFHTFTKSMEKPFSEELHAAFVNTTKHVCGKIQSCVLGYTQSDEISFLLTPYTALETNSWFDNDLEKIVSLSASYFTGFFNKYSGFENLGFFDSRAFNLPKEEVNNYFLWRQRDAERNSISGLAQSLYSHKELDKKNKTEMQEMCFQKGVNWNDLATWKKRGSCIIKQAPNEVYYYDFIKMDWTIDEEIPIFSQNKEYIEKLV